MKKLVLICFVALLAALQSFGGEQDKQKVVKVKVDDTTTYVFVVTKCQLMLKQTGMTLSIGGINFGAGPIKSTGTISVDSKLLQSMNAQAQILDQYQFSSCKDLNQLPLSDPKRGSLVAIHGLSVYTLTQLAYFAQMYSSNADALKDALLKWILQSGDLLDKIWAKQLLSSDPDRTAQKQAVSDNLKYAFGELNISPGTSTMQEALGDPLRKAIQ